jgi:hypothetical protein
LTRTNAYKIGNQNMIWKILFSQSTVKNEH